VCRQPAKRTKAEIWTFERKCRLLDWSCGVSDPDQCRKRADQVPASKVIQTAEVRSDRGGCFASVKLRPGNTADCSTSLFCCPCESAPSSPATDWFPAEGIVSGLPRCPFLLKAKRLFHTLRYASRNELGLLVFDRQFDLSNLSSTRLSPLRLARRGAAPVFILRCAQSEGNDVTRRARLSGRRRSRVILKLWLLSLRRLVLR